MELSAADRLRAWLGEATDATLRQALAAAAADDALVVAEPHGTLVAFRATVRGRRRVAEMDRRGTLLTFVRWTDDGELAEASVRTPDRSWIVVEPRATDAAPWGRSDRLWTSHGPGLANRERPLTVFASLEYGHVDMIPPLAEPARLPPGGGTAVLNLIATLARDHGEDTLRYRGPYPTEQLFVALLESFRYDATVADPLAVFAAGTLTWSPAPHERLFANAGAFVQLRGRVEKVVWNRRAYYRPDWQQVARQTARRVRDVDAAACCSLWAFGRPLEDHLRVDADGTVHALPRRPSGDTILPIPAAVRDGVIEIVVATSAAALSEPVRRDGRRLEMAWRPVDGDLVEARDERVAFSTALREAARTLIGAAGDRRTKLGVALATITEMAGLLGDTLRARAQDAVVSLAKPDQRAALGGADARGADAKRITAAVEALLDDVSRAP